MVRPHAPHGVRAGLHRGLSPGHDQGRVPRRPSPSVCPRQPRNLREFPDIPHTGPPAGRRHDQAARGTARGLLEPLTPDAWFGRMPARGTSRPSPRSPRTGTTRPATDVHPAPRKKWRTGSQNDRPTAETGSAPPRNDHDSGGHGLAQMSGGRPTRVIRQAVRQLMGVRAPGSSRHPSRNPANQERRAVRSRSRSRVRSVHVPR